MRTRQEIKSEINDAIARDEEANGATQVVFNGLAEILLDIRDLLTSKSRKTISADVPLTKREKEILNSLGNDDE